VPDLEDPKNLFARLASRIDAKRPQPRIAVVRSA
jgi:hypothetical protein